MARILFAPAIALGAALVVGDFAAAAEPANPALGFTMTLGGKGTAAEAATAVEDTEEACCRRRYYGCYGGYRGGYGYSSYYGGGGGYGYGGGYSSYYSYRPVYRPIYRPFVYRPFVRPYVNVNYYGGYGYGGGFGGGHYYGINGTQDDAAVPVMSLALAAARNPVATAPIRSSETLDPTGSFRYDGGPANPVPQVKPDAAPRTQTAPSAGLPVSLKKETASPYRYKAYGEK
jgi:hypothetical protein